MPVVKRFVEAKNERPLEQVYLKEHAPFLWIPYYPYAADNEPHHEYNEKRRKECWYVGYQQWIFGSRILWLKYFPVDQTVVIDDILSEREYRRTFKQWAEHVEEDLDITVHLTVEYKEESTANAKIPF